MKCEHKRSVPGEQGDIDCIPRLNAGNKAYHAEQRRDEVTAATMPLTRPEQIRAIRICRRAPGGEHTVRARGKPDH